MNAIMRITTLESVHDSQKKIKIMVWWYHRKLAAIPLLGAVLSTFV